MIFELNDPRYTSLNTNHKTFFGVMRTQVSAAPSTTRQLHARCTFFHALIRAFTSQDEAAVQQPLITLSNVMKAD